MAKQKDMEELLVYERALQAKGYKYICGVDEVGRGPLVGPVTVCAVTLPLDDIIVGVNDSKKVSEKKRVELNKLLREKAIAYSIVSADNNRIDEINILNATKECMKAAVESLSVKPDIVLIDAVDLKLDVETMPIVHGDALSYSIAGASIIAKVERDTYMQELAKEYPQYGFEANKGYGTATHIAALKEFGATKFHRKSFIKNILPNG